jgi:hypothetical protein
MRQNNAILFWTAALLAIALPGCSKSPETQDLPVAIEAPAEVNEIIDEFIKENPVITDPVTRTKYSIKIVKPDTSVAHSIIQVKPDPTKGYSILAIPAPGGKAYDTANEALAAEIRKDIIEKPHQQK